MNKRFAKITISLLLICISCFNLLCGCGIISNLVRISLTENKTGDNPGSSNNTGNSGNNSSTYSNNSGDPGNHAANPINSTGDSGNPSGNSINSGGTKRIKYDSDIFAIYERKVKPNVYLAGKNVGGMTESRLKAHLASVASKYNREPQNAAFDNKTWAVAPDKYGRRLNTGKTAALVLAARQGQKNKYIWDTLKPSVTSSQLKENIRVIASYTTPLLNRRKSRVHNISLAKNKLDFRILMPNEEFSFNNTVGRRAAAKGYQDATIFVRTPKGTIKKDAKGGGVCQISTTLYNAADKCGLKVTERNEHSKDVGYVPKGRDATVSFGSADLKFVNNRQHPIMLRLYLKSNSLTVRIIENRNM